MAVTWTGMQEFKNALHNLPAELTGEATNIVIEAAKSAERDTKAAYPQGPTGNLRRGVTTTVEAIGRGGVSARVKSNAFHANLFENGYRGKKPGGTGPKEQRVVPDSQKMIPIAIRARRQMHVKLIDMVQRHGLVVSQS